MTIEIILQNAVLLLNACHVLGCESERFSSAIKNIEACIEALEKAKKDEEKNEDHHEQG